MECGCVCEISLAKELSFYSRSAWYLLSDNLGLEGSLWPFHACVIINLQTISILYLNYSKIFMIIFIKTFTKNSQRRMIGLIRNITLSFAFNFIYMISFIFQRDKSLRNNLAVFVMSIRAKGIILAETDHKSKLKSDI